MPHIAVKMVEGRSEEQKQRLAEALKKTLMESLGAGEQWVTVTVEDYSVKEWQDVFAKEIKDHPGLRIKPQYDPKILL